MFKPIKTIKLIFKLIAFKKHIKIQIDIKITIKK